MPTKNQLSLSQIQAIVDKLDIEIYPTNELCCGACRHFLYEDIDGYGECEATGRQTYCGNVCVEHFLKDDE